jgi:hypothetical protein
MLLLDDTSPDAIAVDTRLPPSADAIGAVMLDAWPRLAERVRRVEASLDAIALAPNDVVLSIHACGALTDAVLTKALAARARVAVLPCCHDVETCDAGGLDGWMDPALAIDATRAARMRAAGYRVHTQEIPRAITAKNRLLLAAPQK